MVILISTVGINITEHYCASCNLHEKNIQFVASHDHEHEHDAHIEITEMECSTNETCCSTKHVEEEHHQENENHETKCCDFDNKFFKILNLFSPTNNFEVDDAQFFAISIQFNDILSNILNSGFTKLNFIPIKIPNSIPILSKVCRLIL
jgi:hypothetical protein